MSWVDLREGCSFGNGTLTLCNGVKVEGLDKLGLSEDKSMVSVSSYDDKLYLVSNKGKETGAAFIISNDGGYSYFSLKDLDCVLLDFLGWNDVWCCLDTCIARGIDWSYSSICPSYSRSRYKAFISTNGLYGEGPRTYYIKGKISSSSCKSSIDFLRDLSKVFSKVFCTEVDWRCSKYTIAECSDYFLVTYFFISQFSIMDGDNQELPSVSYRLNKSTLEVMGIDVPLMIKGSINMEMFNEHILEHGLCHRGVYDFDDLYGHEDLFFSSSIKKSITKAALKVFNEISKFSSVFKLPIDYLEVSRGIGSLDMGVDFEFGEELRESNQKSINCAYLGVSPMVDGTGFSSNSNPASGGKVAVCVVF